jgi:hypothetical protein
VIIQISHFDPFSTAVFTVLVKRPFFLCLRRSNSSLDCRRGTFKPNSQRNSLTVCMTINVVALPRSVCLTVGALFTGPSCRPVSSHFQRCKRFYTTPPAECAKRPTKRFALAVVMVAGGGGHAKLVGNKSSSVRSGGADPFVGSPFALREQAVQSVPTAHPSISLPLLDSRS